MPFYSDLFSGAGVGMVSDLLYDGMTMMMVTILRSSGYPLIYYPCNLINVLLIESQPGDESD